ncbi:hypothetical protein [Niveibacterium microcysteis]|uniref:Uncharacterized protein n=1 Tax=Niveibacterium microcysteis TaxID=2811415 RepID=A0ABX7MCW1_9RHOO|nr:hypothetical protein [Niveibacterium microcysteis]QSI78673.1 hypothetical protein JY500_08735 [Niveibacterium microcysteis]
MNQLRPDRNFAALPRPVIEAALAAPTGDNPIAWEVARLIEAYSSLALKLIDSGKTAWVLQHTSPETAVEQIAREISAEQVRGIIAARRRGVCV